MFQFLLSDGCSLTNAKTNPGLSNIDNSFFAFQKEARHQEVKDPESKEDERSRKQYPFTCVALD